MTNKVALLIDGAKRIRLAIGQRLAADGATVVFTGRDADKVAASARAISNGAVGLVADTSIPADMNCAVAAVRDTHGRIVVLQCQSCKRWMSALA